MTAREFFNAEIWSGKTSRKIFIGLGVVVFAILLVGLLVASIYAIESLWLTANERTIAKDALDRLDGLRDLVDTNGYEAAHDVARQKVDLAIETAVTVRDQNICSILSTYLNAIESDKRWRELSVKSGNLSLGAVAQNYGKMASNIISSSRSNEDFISRQLHIALK